jgi:asparagine synthase (glutamine-hydrolysing)
MCGIAGIFSYGGSAPPVDREELLRIREAMIRRGPDGAGLWVSPDRRTGLAHRRLAIIDLSESGAQPMATADGRYRITFNGEIYNYRALRAELQAKGCVFRSNSDTEVLLHLYAERGEGMVHALRGMFSFAIHDCLEQRLFLARDPFGIKPLYYADRAGTFRFASQVKALLQGGQVDTTPEPAGHVGFYLWGYVPEPHTLYRGIRSLPAGSSLIVDPSGPGSIVRFFDVTEEFIRADGLSLGAPLGQAAERLHAALSDSVRHHLVADVPVGLFLSSGLDSTTLTALATEVGASDLHTVTLGFNEFRGTPDDETPLAALIARRYATTHRTQWVGRNDFAENLAHMLEAMDQPSTDGVNAYFVSRAAAQSGMKVALSGVGGDELFGGYPSFRDVPRMVGLLGPLRGFAAIGRGFRRVCAPVLERFTSPKYAGLLEYGGGYAGAYLLRRGLYMPWELPRFLDADLVREGWNELQTLARLEDTVRGIGSDAQRVSALELGWYMRNQLLRDADWAGMAHSLEIRVPLADVELFRAVAPLMRAGAASKRDMALAPVQALPAEVLNRGKTGFSIPVRDWLRQSDMAGSVPRGLRGWARKVNPPARRGRRVLALVADAYGGHGGIAKFNRDFLGALCSAPGTAEIVAIPRLMPADPGPLPRKLTYLADALDSKVRYALRIVSVLAGRRPFDIVVCGHINLMPMAWLASVLSGARLVLVVHGIDAWKPTGSAITNALARRVDAYISVSGVTMRRFSAWTHLGNEKGHVLPNSIDLSLFTPGPKDPELVAKYALQGRVLIMTMGRLVSSERYKGFDEVMGVLGEAIREVPGLAYMIAGEGDDRARLEEKADRLGIREHMVFTGFVPEEEKRAYYNLADAFVMPSRGEGFGIVFLEAMACGLPVVGSTIDGSREALRDGELGMLVDPDEPDAIRRAIGEAVRQPKRVREGLEYFSQANFERRVHEIVERW